MDYRFETAISEILEEDNEDSHPLITTAKFIFADDRPNNNKQAIPFSEFASIAKSAIGMPVKIKFTGFSADRHPGAYPIGHIQSMEIVNGPDGSHQLIAEAALWSEEFPEIVTWLKEAFADGTAPGISWELKYKEGIIENGIEWLKGIVTAAATFVKSPAYGPRTALLALASIKNPEERGDEIADLLLAIAEQLKTPDDPIIEDDNKGGNRMTPEEEAKLRADAAKAEEATLAIATKQSEIEELLGKIQTKDDEITALQEENASLKQAALVDARVRKYTETVGALPAEASEADKKKSIFASFTDDQFEDYIAEIVAVKAAAPAANSGTASLRARASLEIPKPDVQAASSVTFETLRTGLKGLARPNSVE